MTMLEQLMTIIADRQANPRPNSYTNRLLDAGTPTIAQKVGEEAVEVVIAALSQGKERTIEEVSDLLYHLLVLLTNQGISLDAIDAELARRHAPTPPSDTHTPAGETL